MAPEHVRICVLRLLAGDVRIEDINTLFRYLRTRSYGNKVVKEMGDFISHREERDEGIVVNDVTDFFIFYRKRIQDYYFQSLDLRNMPDFVPEVLEANLRRMDSQTVLEVTGKNAAAANQTLKAALRKIYTKSDGRLAFSENLTRQEWRVFDGLWRTMHISPAFTTDELFDGLCIALEKNGLLESAERSNFEKLRRVIAAHAVATMHWAEVKLGDGSIGHLYARIAQIGGKGDPILQIYAQSETLSITDRTKPMGIAYPVFTSSANPAETCDPALLAIPSQDWDFPLELNAEGQLTRMSVTEKRL